MDVTLLPDFLVEARTLLDDLEYSRLSLREEGERETQIATVDRALHSLQGSASAMALRPMGRGAGSMLQRWRKDPSKLDAALGEFLEECRRYLDALERGDDPRDEYFADAADFEPAPRRPGDGPSIDDILAAVPELSPDVDGLVSAAVGRLLEPEPKAVVELPTVPIEAPEDLNVRPDELHALRCDTLMRRIRDGDTEGAVRLLRQLRDESRRAADRESLQPHLDAALADLQRLAQAEKLPLRGRVEPSGVRVQQIVGELVRHYVTTVLCATVLNRRGGQRPNFELSAGYDAGLVSVRMLNVGGEVSPAALKRIAKSLDFLDELDGALEVGMRAGDLMLSLDVDRAFSARLCEIETERGRYCVPVESIIGAPMAEDGELALRCGRGLRRMRVSSVGAATDFLVVGVKPVEDERVILGHALSLRRSARIPVLDPEML